MIRARLLLSTGLVALTLHGTAAIAASGGGFASTHSGVTVNYLKESPYLARQKAARAASMPASKTIKVPQEEPLAPSHMPLAMPEAPSLAVPMPAVPLVEAPSLPTTPLYPQAAKATPSIREVVAPPPAQKVEAVPAPLENLPFQSNESATPAVSPLAAIEEDLPTFQSYATIETKLSQQSTLQVPAPQKAEESLKVSASQENLALPPLEGLAAPTVEKTIALPEPTPKTPIIQEALPTPRAPVQPDTMPQLTMPPLPPATPIATVNAYKEGDIVGPEPLSAESRQIINKIPTDLDKPKTERAQKLSIDRIDPEIQGILDSKPEGADTVTTHEGVGVSIQVSQPKFNADAALESAYDALMQGEDDITTEIYKEILAKAPSNQDALFGLATTYHRMNRTEIARPLYGKLLSINPGHREGLNNFLILISEEAPSEALVQLQELEIQNPDFAPIPAQMGILSSKMGDLDAARKYMIRALALDGDNLAYQFNLAVILDKQEHYKEAATAYRRLLKAADRGEKIPTDVDDLQQRLTFISSNKL